VLEKSPMEPLAERELTVRLAIDVVHPGAGEPIEVSVDPDGSLLVTTYRLAPELETELRARLERIQGVTLHSATGGQAPQPIAPPDASALDRAIPLSQDVSFEAHFLAELATRFTPPMESELSAQSRTSLRELRVKHVAELKRGLAALRLQLERQHPDFHPGPSPAESPDGLQIQSMADSATNVERSIAVLYAGSEPESEQAASWRQLAAALGSLQGLATSYSRYLEQHRKELQ
jgi:hypothetical protein